MSLQGQFGDKWLKTGKKIWKYFLLNQCFSHNVLSPLMDELFKIGIRSPNKQNTEHYSQSRKEIPAF